MSAHPAPPTPPLVPEVALGTFTNELGGIVTSIALGQPKVAVLGTDPWLKTNGKWEKIALPEKLRTGVTLERTRIYFGRDDLPRLMGSQDRDGQRAQLYLRYRKGAWSVEKKEIARLLDQPPKPLWGLLGHADPEVVCKQDDVCIIKRLTGWKTMPAGPGTPRVELQGGVAWALSPDGLARLEDDKRWIPVPMPTGGASALHGAGGFAVIGDEIWISEPATDKLLHYRNGAWSVEPAPMGKPRGLWATSRSDVWLAGAAGLAHYDGTSWSRVKGPQGPLAEVTGRGQEVWAAGDTGLWSSATR